MGNVLRSHCSLVALKEEEGLMTSSKMYYLRNVFTAEQYVCNKIDKHKLSSLNFKNGREKKRADGKLLD